MNETLMGEHIAGKPLTNKRRQVLTFVTRVQQEGRCPPWKRLPAASARGRRRRRTTT